MPQPGTDYIYTTAYYAKGSTWLPVTLTGDNAAPSYSLGVATGALSSSVLSTLTPSTNYVVLWDWLWDATAGCYKGPGLNQCNTGVWRLQTFGVQSGLNSTFSLSPAVLNFPSEPVGVTSPVAYETLANTGNVTVNLIGSYSITGDFAFAGVGTCLSAIVPGTSCTLSVKFTPTAVGVRTGQVVITDDAVGSPHIFDLSGTGTASTYTYSQSTYTSTTCTSNCFYISPTGSDANAGTSAAAPWKTFVFAIPKLKPGYTLLLENGTYTGTNSGYPSINCSSGASNGTAAAPITVQAQNERQAWLQSQGGGPTLYMNNCSYWNIVGLHNTDGDFAGESEDGTVVIYNSSHILYRRNIVDHSNRCHNDHLVFFHATTNSIAEENEMYFFHRGAIQWWSGSNNNESLRNYANSRTYDSTAFTCSSGTYDPQKDQYGQINYGSSFNTMENNITENATSGQSNEPIGTYPSPCSTAANNNTVLGSVELNNIYGFNTHPHSSTSLCVLNGLTYSNDVIIHPTSIGIYLRSAVGSTLSHISMFSSMAASGNYNQDHPPENSTPTTAAISNSEIVPNTTLLGYNIAAGTATLDHVGSFGGTISNASVTNPFTQNPAFGSCYLWVPASSPLKGAGSGGSDIGANILYAYQGGTLTNTKLWNTDGSFASRGAIVPGLNDVAGSSLFDIQNRLNVNKNGCSFPAGY
jgi:hypothetical protein